MYLNLRKSSEGRRNEIKAVILKKPQQNLTLAPQFSRVLDGKFWLRWGRTPAGLVVNWVNRIGPDDRCGTIILSRTRVEALADGPLHGTFVFQCCTGMWAPPQTVILSFLFCFD